jgi:hypothetical protein
METSSVSNDASAKDSSGQSAPGKDAGDNDKGQVIIGEAGKPKTAKESMEDPSEPPLEAYLDRFLGPVAGAFCELDNNA